MVGSGRTEKIVVNTGQLVCTERKLVHGQQLNMNSVERVARCRTGERAEVT